MQIRLGPRAEALPGLREAFEQQTPSSGDVVVLVRLIGLRRHLAQRLVVSIIKERDEGGGAVVSAPS